MRFSSAINVRIQIAFGGISRSSSFSTAPTKTYSLFWKET